jgi:hypothetical protein
LEWGGVRDSLREETHMLLALQAGSTQTQLEELQEDPFNQYLQDISKLISKISIGGLDQHNIELLRCHPFYRENKTLVEKFISSMEWQGPTEEEVHLADKSLFRGENYDPHQIISLSYYQTDLKPVQITSRRNKTHSTWIGFRKN